ncbi:methyl-accepting chemotaxis protein [Aliiroseovarius sp.]|uniref:methyl-accepting chemotaxis protein n=1 Tax=Aliiroseovarius sp. TaxID=1872442 RepID=UPI003BAC1D4E
MTQPLRLHSVKTRILGSILGALFLFIAGYTLFWSTRYTHQLEATFEEEITLAPHFLAAPISDAIWNFQPDIAAHSLQGLDALSFTEFARVIVRDDVMAEFLALEAWKPHWDGAIGRFDLASTEEQIRTEGHETFIAEPLLTEEGELLGQLVIGFSRSEIEGLIRSAYIQAGAIGLGIFVVFAALALFISNSVTGPLNRVIALIDRMRDGDTDWHAEDADRHDEFGKLGQAVEEFRDNLLDKQRLEREEAEARQQQQELNARLAKEEKAREEEARRAREERDAIEAQEAERQAQEEARQRAEREARAAEQQAVVTALADGLGALAAGRLTFRLETPFAEGYEKLRTDFNDAIGALQAALLTIAANGDEINRNTTEISTAASDLARRTETTAATLEQTASALDSITGSVQQSAEGAKRADDVVRDIRAKSENSGKVVRNAVNSMAGIKESSDKIAKVIEVIDGVAFQTNLLALNAGVEAARAGEAGRGFAVVAQEVRDLSQRTAAAAQEVGDLIRISSDQVDQGVQSVDEAGRALDNILHSILDISSFVSEIASSAVEQSTGISEINTAITQLDSATQQNAAMFEETTAASQALNGEAMSLSEALAHFDTGLGQITQAADTGTPDETALWRSQRTG